MKTLLLCAAEMAFHNANRLTILTHADLTEAAANTAQGITIASVPAGYGFGLTKTELQTALQDASDAAFNTTTLKIGDSGDDDRFLPAVELNANGTEIKHAFGPTAVAATYAAPDATPAAISGGEDPTEAEHNALRSTVDSIRTQVVALAADVAALRLRLAAAGHLYASATDVVATFGSQSGKALADVDTGEIHIYWTMYQLVNA